MAENFLKSLRRVLGFGLLLVVIFPAKIWAYVAPSCSKLGAPHHEWNDSRSDWRKSIFVGKALRHNKKGGYDFEVQKSWTVDTPKYIVVRQRYGMHAKFEILKSYLVYGEYADENFKVVLLDPCAEEKPVKKASLEFEFLEAANDNEKIRELIKELPAVIQTHSGPNVRKEAIQILMKLDKEEYPREQRVDVFLKALKDPHPEVRAAAAESFNPENEVSNDPGILYHEVAGDKIIDGLIPLLQDDDLNVRWKSASALKHVGRGSDRGVPPLIAAYEKEIAEPEGGEEGSPVPSDYLIEAFFLAMAENRSQKARKYMLPIYKDSLTTGKRRRRTLYYLLGWGLDAQVLESQLLELFKRRTKPLNLPKTKGSSKKEVLQSLYFMSKYLMGNNEVQNVLRILGNMRSRSVVPLVIKFIDRQRVLFADKDSCKMLLLAIRALDAAGTPQALKELEYRLLPSFLESEKKKKPPCRGYVLYSFGQLTSKISKKAEEQLREIRKQRDRE
jgi:hypothetical protein